MSKQMTDRFVSQTTGWQPVSTAPKDGTKIVIYDGDVPAVAFWHKPKDSWVVDWDHSVYDKATLWCPLPKCANAD